MEHSSTARHDPAALIAAVRSGGRGGTARCPAHDDRTPSLSVSAGRSGGVVLHCHAGCPPEQVVAALGMTMSDLAAPGSPSGDGDWMPGGTGPATATYTYTDEHGRTLFGVCRDEKKNFRQWRPDPASRSGRAWSLNGTRRVPYRLPQVIAAARDGQTVHVVEGEKDVHAVERAGGTATCNPGGAGKWRAEYAAHLSGAHVVVVADRDDPGRDHAADVAATLQGVAASIRVVEAAEGKDTADHLAAGRGLDGLMDVVTPDVHSAPAEDDDDEDDDGTPRRPTQADRLLRLAAARWRFAADDTGAVVGVPYDGPPVVLPLRGGPHSVRARLAALHFAEESSAPSSSALADACNVLEGAAGERGEQVTPALRVARHDGRLVLDLGGPSGDAAIVGPDGWEVGPSPVPVRRTALTAALPTPTRGGTLDDLRGLLRVDDDDWPLLLAWLVAALLPDIPHPVVMLTGQQGAAKSSAARMLAALVDPSPAPLRTAPKDVEGWAVAAAGSWVVAVDNVSTIEPWWSDALCRTVTGDGMVRRRLYSDSELTVLAFRRAVILTAIDSGALRGDLADRALTVELGAIADEDRREDAEVSARWAEVHPGVLGALLDLAAGVLAVLPDVRLPTLPRMADYARIVAAVDLVEGSDGLDHYLGSRQRLAADLVDGDTVAAAVRALSSEPGREQRGWSGPAGELHEALAAHVPQPPPPSWPKSPRGLVTALRRCTPALAQVGVEVAAGTRSGATGSRVWTVRRAGSAGQTQLSVGGPRHSERSVDGAQRSVDSQPADLRERRSTERTERTERPDPTLSIYDVKGQKGERGQGRGDIERWADDAQNAQYRQSPPDADLPPAAGDDPWGSVRGDPWDDGRAPPSVAAATEGEGEHDALDALIAEKRRREVRLDLDGGGDR